MKWLSPTPNVFYSMAVIIGILIFNSIALFILKKIKPKKNYEVHINILKTWWLLDISFLGVLLVSVEVVLIYFVFISYFALKEYFSILPQYNKKNNVPLLVYIAVPLQYFWIYIGWYEMAVIFIPLFMFLFISISIIIKGKPEGFLKIASGIHWGLMTAVFIPSYIGFILVLPKEKNPVAGGIGLVLYLLFLTEFNDIFQYFWGTFLGRKKVLPKISPNKTWAGLIGGAGTTTFFAYLISPYLTPLTGITSIISGLIISTGGFLGDVTISALKRDIGIKDTGTILPGHGGLLDRFDSLSFTAPLFFYFIRYIYF